MNTSELINLLASKYKVKAEQVQVEITKSKFNKSKSCFDNSYDFCSYYDNSKYIVGYYVYRGLPIEHAWVKLGNKYLELTLKEVDANAEYYPFFELNSLDLALIVNKTESPPSLYECLKYRKSKQ